MQTCSKSAFSESQRVGLTINTFSRGTLNAYIQVTSETSRLGSPSLLVACNCSWVEAFQAHLDIVSKLSSTENEYWKSPSVPPTQVHAFFSICCAAYIFTRIYWPWSYPKKRQTNPYQSTHVACMLRDNIVFWEPDAFITVRDWFSHCSFTATHSGCPCISSANSSTLHCLRVKLDNTTPDKLFDPAEVTPIFLWIFLEN